ncbi:MAG: metal-dependent hydrolase [Gemmatimonadaceae bacterium]|nr:metal-dependent hydrolase [Gemmatimonadaceae bacterium]
MDNATHAFAGLLLADATALYISRRTAAPIDRPLRRTLVWLGVVAAELPDADLLYSGPVVGMGKLGYLLHHRGHTHTILFALGAAFLMWYTALWWRRRSPAPPASASLAVERRALLALAVAGTLSHLALDYTNSYGIHPFWPFDNRWIYGDMVFIVEPWLWVVAIPALWFGPRQRWGRVVLALLLCAILAASFTLGELTRSLAIAVAVGAVVWSLCMWRVSGAARVLMGIGAWCTVEGVFALSSARAGSAAREAMRTVAPDEVVADVVVSPGAGNPFCFDALVISNTATTYAVRAATIAPWSALRANGWRSTGSCRARDGGTRITGLDGVQDLQPTNVRGVRFAQRWSVSRASLVQLRETYCEVGPGLRFYRVPAWRVDSTTAVMSDIRFGVGEGGFSDLVLRRDGCTLPTRAWIPPWTPPRSELDAG